MRIILAAITLLMLATPAWAQSPQDDVAQCNAPDSETKIKGCTALIDARGYRGADLANIYYDRGVGYARLHQSDAAIADYSMAISLKSDFAAAYTNRGSAYVDKAKLAQAVPGAASALYAQAIADYTRAIGFKPDFIEAYNNRAIAYSKTGMIDLSIADLSKSISISPNLVAFRERGVDYAHKGMRDEAVADFTNAIALNPSSAELYFDRGYEYIEQRKFDQARADLSMAIGADPNSAVAYYWRGTTFTIWDNRTNRPSTDIGLAMQDYDAAIRLRPGFAEAFKARGFCRALMVDLDGAIADFSEAIRINANDPLAFRERGSVYATKGEWEKGIADFDQALKLKPDWPQALVGRGVARPAIHDDVGAIADLDRAIALSANDNVSLWLALGGRCEVRARAALDLDQALLDCSRAIQIDASKPAPFDARALAHIRLHQYGEAISDCQQSIALDPNLAGCYYLRGIAEKRIGRTREAAADIARAAAISPKVVADYASLFDRGTH